LIVGVEVMGCHASDLMAPFSLKIAKIDRLMQISGLPPVRASTPVMAGEGRPSTTVCQAWR